MRPLKLLAEHLRHLGKPIGDREVLRDITRCIAPDQRELRLTPHDHQAGIDVAQPPLGGGSCHAQCELRERSLGQAGAQFIHPAIAR